MSVPNVKAKRYWCSSCQSVFRTSFPLCPLDGASLAPLEGDPLVGATLDGRYVIEECVGEGGMGRIYRARHRHMSRRFAIKMLFGDLAADEKMRARFHQEAEAACRLSHPNVVSVVDVGETATKQPYLAMDYVDGVSLKRLIKEQAPLKKRRAAALLWQLASGLSHAHDKGLVHRDFKPANVLVVDDGRGEMPKILDFGIARIMEDGFDNEFTTAGTVMGTPAYMSPEHAMGEDLDHRTDLFSLGVVLYQMLCGKLPFAGSGPEVVNKNLTVPPPAIATRVPGLVVDPVLEGIAHRLMAKKPSARYQSGKEVVTLLVDSSLVRTDSRGAGEPRLTLLRASEPIPPPEHPGQSGMMSPMEAYQSSTMLPMVGYNGTIPPSQQAGTIPPGSYHNGTMPPGSYHNGTIPPGSYHDGTIPPGSYHDGTIPPGQQWTRPPTQGDHTMHVQTASHSNNRRLKIAIVVLAASFALIISILLILRLGSKSQNDGQAPPVDAAAKIAIDAGAIDAGAVDAEARTPDPPKRVDAGVPDARTRVTNNGQRPRTVSRAALKKRYKKVGRLINRLLDARSGSSKANQLKEEYLAIEYIDAMDDAVERRKVYKRLGRLRAKILKYLP